MNPGPDIGEIYDRCAPRIYRYIYHRLGQQALAEDLTGEVFVHFLRARVTPDNLMAYLYRTAHNLIVDYLRQNPSPFQTMDDEMAAEGDSPERLAEREDEKRRLRRAISRLSPDQQQVIVLRYLEGLSNAEIGRVLGKPEGAVKSLQHRAMVNLRGLLGEASLPSGEWEWAGLES